MNVNDTKTTFDLNVQLNRRSHVHHALHPNEPIWIAASRGTAIQLVITKVASDQVEGFWKQVKASSQLSTRAGSKSKAPR